ncbi:hypothetical protein L1O03_08410 [Corynebacterium uropygiale]|uniref:DUF6985 domain-containing protein n=1 Tax=Corynebacterium uropygiale TaxID=1775911 RepID=A0A9X1QPX6_9CORY|nr:hypothetical protein [Corynebacterium uropygiale]MCF4007194.1 hypothetical protein [Corynebacterium uropygiale]
MSLPGIGELSEGEFPDEVITPALDVTLFEADIPFRIEDYDPADNDLIVKAIQAFRALEHSDLLPATDPVYRYYKDFYDDQCDDEEVMEWLPVIENPEDVWNHVTMGRCEPIVQVEERDKERHAVIYLECECEWEEEHGLAFAFLDGTTLIEAGPCEEVF